MIGSLVRQTAVVLVEKLPKDYYYFKDLEHEFAPVPRLKTAELWQCFYTNQTLKVVQQPSDPICTYPYTVVFQGWLLADSRTYSLKRAIAYCDLFIKNIPEFSQFDLIPSQLSRSKKERIEYEMLKILAFLDQEYPNPDDDDESELFDSELFDIDLANMGDLTMKTPPLGMTQDNFCATLQGAKTETRRLLTLKDRTQEEVNGITSFCQDGDGNWIGHFGNTFGNLDELAEFTKTAYPKGFNKGIKSRYQIGDRCYLTEPTQNFAGSDYKNKKLHIQYFWHNRESRWVSPTDKDLIKINDRKTGIYSKQNARFMLKSFARYWVEIVEVKLERLLDITVEGAISEGVKSYIQDENSGYDKTLYWDYLENRFAFTCPKRSYISEIEMLHGKAIADSNPWVWVYKFKLVGEN